MGSAHTNLCRSTGDAYDVFSLKQRHERRFLFAGNRASLSQLTVIIATPAVHTA